MSSAKGRLFSLGLNELKEVVGGMCHSNYLASIAPYIFPYTKGLLIILRIICNLTIDELKLSTIYVFLYG